MKHRLTQRMTFSDLAQPCSFVKICANLRQMIHHTQFHCIVMQFRDCELVKMEEMWEVLCARFIWNVYQIKRIYIWKVKILAVFLPLLLIKIGSFSLSNKTKRYVCKTGK